VAVGAERIRAFDATIEVEPHDAFTVVETIAYDFGAEQRHGIFRRIPVRYGRGHAADYRIGLDVERVDDGAGTPLPFRVSHAGRDVTIRIGDPDRTVTGTHTYRIRYRVTRGVLYFADHDEIYWNVTGTEWPVPIERAGAVVLLPGPSDPHRLMTGCFTGPRGSVAHDCTAAPSPDGTHITVEAAGPLGVGSGLTLVLGLPKGMLVEPTLLDRLWARVTDWVTWLYLLPIATLAVMTRLWRRYGRDPAGRAAIAVAYEPPRNMTPAEMGTVVDETVQLADITATVLDLAVRGALRIEERDSTSFLFLNHRDYELVRLPSSEPLRPFESELLDALFCGEQRVLVSSLRNHFYRHVPELKRALYDVVAGGRWFASSPDRIRTGWRLGGLAALGLAALVFLVSQSFATALPVALTGLVILAFSPFMPRRTADGHRAYEEILGFKEFLMRVDRDRLARTGGRTAGRFERILPYAVVLGAADQWAEAFADVYTQAPTWYVGPTGRVFDSRAFVSDVGRSMDTLGSTMASQPSGSGRSGFSSGGGFSGGGFGGGGGGSW
jgi:hypothetical protein